MNFLHLLKRWHLMAMMGLLEMMVALVFVLPYQQDIARRVDEVSGAENQLQQMKAHRGEGSALDEAAQRYADTLAFWPDGLSPERWLAEASTWARASQVKLLRLRPGKEVDHGEYTGMSLEVAMRGDYGAIVVCLARMLSHADHAGLVSLNIMAKDDIMPHGEVEAEAVIELRQQKMLSTLGLARWQPPSDPEEIIRRAGDFMAMQRDPFHPVVFAGNHSGETDLQPLQQLDPGHLVLRGSLMGRGDTWGIVQSGDGKLYQISRGDLLGHPPWRVKYVTQSEVLLVSATLPAAGREAMRILLPKVPIRPRGRP